MVLRLFQSARTQRDPTHGVQRFGGEDIVAQTARDLVTAIAQLVRPLRLVAVVQHDGESPQGFGEHRRLAVALGGGDGGFVTLNGFGDDGCPLFGAGFVQEIGSGTHFEEWTNRTTAPSRSGLPNPLFRVGVTHQPTT